MQNRLSVSPDQLRVALLILNESRWSRSVLEGIGSFAREQGGWDFWMPPRGLNNRLMLPHDWQGRGVICRMADNQLRRSIERHDLPAVNISWHGEQCPRFPKVVSDADACGTMAINYFLDHGFDSFGYIGPPLCYGYKDRIVPALQRAINPATQSLSIFQQDPDSPSPDYDYQRGRLNQWVRSLPKPCAVVAWGTIVAREVMMTCAAEKIHVPNDVAVLAVEHDPLISKLSPLPISYIQQRPETVGYKAAELLKRMMNGQSPPEDAIMIAPEGIVEKMSTDTRFSNDEIVQAAIVYIQRHANLPIQVSDIANHLHVSRRSLEDRFRRTLNRTPADVIRTAKLKRLKELLRKTTLSLFEVSHQSGFDYQEAMIRFFKRSTGMTPGVYRRSYLTASAE